MSVKKIKSINVHKCNTQPVKVSLSSAFGMWGKDNTYTYDGLDGPSCVPSLDINWDKVRKEMSEEGWEKLICDSICKWLSYNGSDRIEELLKHVGYLATNRENSLNNLLESDETLD